MQFDDWMKDVRKMGSDTILAGKSCRVAQVISSLTPIPPITSIYIMLYNQGLSGCAANSLIRMGKMGIRFAIFAVFASLFSTGVYAAPVYYTFDVQLTYVYDNAGLASTEGIEVGDTLSVVFLVDRELDGTETRLSMYPILNQKFTNTKYDTTYNNGHTVYDYFYADMITPPLLHGDSWDDLGQIEANYGSAVRDNSVYYFNLYGSDSPDTTGALTTLTSYPLCQDSCRL